VTADIADSEAVARTVGSVEQAEGHIDILVNSAGILLQSPALAVTREEWTRVVTLNQEAVFFCCQETARRMQRTGATSA
jgi:NAD(P)-dependent dehydrogenase (short-subunit alcohol dehydrogenase family)